MSKDSKAKIKKIADIIVANNKPEKIILFGSYAWGTPNKNSDIDLFVVENKTGSRRQRQIDLRRLLIGVNEPTDVLSYNKDEIKDRLDLGDSFLKKIITDGIVIYGK